MTGTVVTVSEFGAMLDLDGVRGVVTRYEACSYKRLNCLETN